MGFLNSYNYYYKKIHASQDHVKRYSGVSERVFERGLCFFPLICDPYSPRDESPSGERGFLNPLIVISRY